MEVKILLELLHNTKNLSALDYAKCDSKLVNFLDLISVEEDFVQRIDLGIVYLKEITSEKSIVVDGLSRLLSLSLLLHAICECYKKTSDKNDKAIRTIRKKYLLNNTKTKLRLPKNMQNVYDKIIYGERLSGKEKENPMFVLLHNFWVDIKENRLQASHIFGMLEKITVTVVATEYVSPRDLYYSLNHNKRELNHILLIEDYLSKAEYKKIWNEIKEIYKNKTADIKLFFKDFFQNKFNYKEFNENMLYEYFVNYFETMSKYSKGQEILAKIKHSSELYLQLINVDIPDKDIRNGLIQLKFYDCEDTFAYLLSVYEDYDDGNLSQATFLEILSAVKEYLQNREKSQNDVSFNELIKYLNAFIAYK